MNNNNRRQFNTNTISDNNNIQQNRPHKFSNVVGTTTNPLNNNTNMNKNINMNNINKNIKEM